MTGEINQFSSGNVKDKWWYPEADDQTGTSWVKPVNAVEILFWLFFIQMIFNTVGCFLGIANSVCNDGQGDNKAT